ncbi:CAF17-like 4Fe-4S cluster assembly/insertion protein YgfZ [Maritalea mediterranea]|uniref:Folate-binding protein n=1 Tax=Maritalea mediterranea TaxID=2909667 RepID=A0ABS9E8X1_9HYPH|nr:folate-binding protein [Maritalea mediterranea]MCF4097863.1 folate-binding protein [Maritalea mediterranea]
MPTIFKLDRKLISFSGPDAEKLLHDTLTANVRALEEKTCQWFALLSPQGKILFEGQIFRLGDALYTDLDSALVDDFFKRMRLYKMRANVEMEAVEDMAVGWSSEETDEAFKDIRPGMGFRHYAAIGDAEDWDDGTAAYTQTRFENGIAACPADFEPNSFFAHDIGMDLLPGAIDFKKGCYIGQEVVSRMQHRGTARKRIMCVSAEAPLDAPGPIEANEKKIGDLLNVSDRLGLALVRTDKAKKGATFLHGEQPVQLAAPHWASYDLSDS